jgi:predicted nuclease of predicted toxin-antitoxin system
MDFKSYTKGKKDAIELVKRNLEFTLRCGNVTESDIERMIKFCNELIELYNTEYNENNRQTN